MNMTLKERIAAARVKHQPTSISELPLKDRIAALKIEAARLPTAPLNKEEDIEEDHQFDDLKLTDRYGKPIVINKKQADAVRKSIAGESFVISGEAGVGKTTTLQAVGKALWLHHKEKLHEVEYRANDGSGRRVIGISVAFVSFTRRAVANIARALCQDEMMREVYSPSIMTIHNLIEYSPVFEWSDKYEKEIRVFRPQRTALNPLDITHLYIEESSMVDINLWQQLYDALPENVQIIFMGDINQVQPVFGQPVLGYALRDLEIIYLNHVYRQALDNEIIACAHNILRGKLIEPKGKNVHWLRGKPGNITPSADRMAQAMRSWIHQALDNHRTDADSPFKYNPEEDIILLPWNKPDKPMTTYNINNMVAQRLGEERGADVWHVIAGFNQWFLAVGDRVFCNKMEGTIIDIRHNMSYVGKSPTPHSTSLNRWGFLSMANGSSKNVITDLDDAAAEFDFENFDVDSPLDENKETSRAASHVVTVELDLGGELRLASAGDFNPQFFSLGYALSIHKAQGSEWPRVILMFHKVHMPMMSRELLYTAVTRARDELIILSREDIIRKAIGSPRIKGDTLKEKIEYFNSGYLDKDVPLIK